MKLRILALTLMLAAGAGTQAQTKKELVAKLLQVQQQGIENIGRSLAAQPAQQMLQAAGQALQRLPADKREAVGRDIQADIKKFHDEVEPLLRERALRLAPTVAGAIYEEKLTEDELKQVIAWMESPTSRKIAQLDRELGNALAEKVVADTKATVDGKLKTLEASIGKRLGLPAAPAAAAPPASGAAPKKK
jgi:uncharacterized protein